jgi:hypothetical protein
VSVTLDRAAPLSADLYDALGRHVAALGRWDRVPAGVHTIDVRAGNLAPGVYLLRVQTDRRVVTLTAVRR